MKEGYWLNYKTGQTVPIGYKGDHERWIRGAGNARELGVPADIIRRFGEFTPCIDRDRFLTFVLRYAPVMRVRGHIDHVTFEFHRYGRAEGLRITIDIIETSLPTSRSFSTASTSARAEVTNIFPAPKTFMHAYRKDTSERTEWLTRRQNPSKGDRLETPFRNRNYLAISCYCH